MPTSELARDLKTSGGGWDESLRSYHPLSRMRIPQESRSDSRLISRLALGNKAGDHGRGVDDYDRHPGCQYPSDDAVFFTTPDSAGTVIAVSTQWHLVYFQELEDKFQKQLNATLVEEPERCGWYALETVVKAAVHRGEIQWYHPVAANSTDRMFSCEIIYQG